MRLSQDISACHSPGRRGTIFANTSPKSSNSLPGFVVLRGKPPRVGPRPCRPEREPPLTARPTPPCAIHNSLAGLARRGQASLPGRGPCPWPVLPGTGRRASARAGITRNSPQASRARRPTNRLQKQPIVARIAGLPCPHPQGEAHSTSHRIPLRRASATHFSPTTGCALDRGRDAYQAVGKPPTSQAQSQHPTASRAPFMPSACTNPPPQSHSLPGGSGGLGAGSVRPQVHSAPWPLSRRSLAPTGDCHSEPPFRTPRVLQDPEGKAKNPDERFTPTLPSPVEGEEL
jgi:hypothetical protein